MEKFIVDAGTSHRSSFFFSFVFSVKKSSAVAHAVFSCERATQARK